MPFGAHFTVLQKYILEQLQLHIICNSSYSEDFNSTNSTRTLTVNVTKVVLEKRFIASSIPAVTHAVQL